MTIILSCGTYLYLTEEGIIVTHCNDNLDQLPIIPLHQKPYVQKAHINWLQDTPL
jgi:hypothetical protein